MYYLTLMSCSGHFELKIYVFPKILVSYCIRLKLTDFAHFFIIIYLLHFVNNNSPPTFITLVVFLVKNGQPTNTILLCYIIKNTIFLSTCFISIPDSYVYNIYL